MDSKFGVRLGQTVGNHSQLHVYYSRTLFSISIDTEVVEFDNYGSQENCRRYDQEREYS
jgi:hypothetical protein